MCISTIIIIIIVIIIVIIIAIIIITQERWSIKCALRPPAAPYLPTALGGLGVMEGNSKRDIFYI